VRALQIDDRIRDLHERNQWIEDARMARGSTPEQVGRAADYVRLAQDRASEAADRSLSAHLRAAIAHDRTAATLEELATTGVGGSAAYTERARMHREWAMAEREAAGLPGQQGPATRSPQIRDD